MPSTLKLIPKGPIHLCFILKLHIIFFIIIFNGEILSLTDSYHDYNGQNPSIVGMCWVTVMRKKITVMIMVVMMNMMTVMNIHLEDEHTDNHNDDKEEKEEGDGDADDFSRLELFAVISLD